MYRTSETKKRLWDIFENDELWDERQAGLDEILESVVDQPLPQVLAEAYIFGYQHALGIHKEDKPEGEIEVPTGLLGFLRQ